MLVLVRVYNPGCPQQFRYLYKTYTPPWLVSIPPLGAIEWGTALCNCVFTYSSILLINTMAHTLQIAHIKNVL